MSALNLTTPQPISARRSGLVGFIEQHPVLTLFALVYLFEWIVLVPQALASQGLFPQIPAILALAVGWGPGLAAVIVTGPEGFSHLPYFFNKGIAFYQTVGIVAFMLFSFALTIVYTWVFNNTRGSLLLVTLLHASQNTWANLLSDNTARPFDLTVGLLIVFAIGLVIVFGPARLSRKPATGFPQPRDSEPGQAISVNPD